MFQIHPDLAILWTTKMTHTVLTPRDSKIFEAVHLRHFHGFGDAPLHECDRHNFRLCVDAHRWPPCASAAGGIN